MAEPRNPQNADSEYVSGLPGAVIFGIAVGLWNFFAMFQGWVVASQAEIAGANIFFFFLGVIPWIGIIASGRRKKWGPSLVIWCVVIAATGFFFVKTHWSEDWQRMLWMIGLYFVPLLAVGLTLRYWLLTDQKGAQRA